MSGLSWLFGTDFKNLSIFDSYETWNISLICYIDVKSVISFDPDEMPKSILTLPDMLLYQYGYSYTTKKKKKVL